MSLFILLYESLHTLVWVISYFCMRLFIFLYDTFHNLVWVFSIFILLWLLYDWVKSKEKMKMKMKMKNNFQTCRTVVSTSRSTKFDLFLIELINWCFTRISIFWHTNCQKYAPLFSYKALASPNLQAWLWKMQFVFCCTADGIPVLRFGGLI